MRHYRRKRTYPTRDRVLVHLSSPGLRPEEQTQAGIAAATRSGRSTLTKWLGRLREAGLVAGERLRIPGHALPRYGYRLTDAGWRQATALRERLGGAVVAVRAPHLGSLFVHVGEVPNLASFRIDLTTAVSLVREERLDLTAKAVAPRGPAEPLVWGPGLRHVDRWYGRPDEMASLSAWLASDASTLLVTGLPGIGKSTLVAEWVRRSKLSEHVFGFLALPSSTAAGLLADLGAFLRALGRPSLASQLGEERGTDLARTQRLLTNELTNLRTIVVLDGMDQAPRDVVRLVREVLARLADQRLIKLVLISRRSLAWASSVGAGSQVLRVRGLDARAATDLLRSSGFEGLPAALRQTVTATRGHPLLIRLVARGSAASHPSLHGYLEDELWQHLTDDERSALEVAAVLRRPVSDRLLAAAANVPPAVLAGLEERNLLDRTVAGGLLIQDLVRDFTLDRLDAAAVRGSHDRAARPLLREPGPRERWEGAWHLLAAGKVAEAAQFLDADGAPLEDSVAAEEIVALARGLPRATADSTPSCVFSEILGDGLRILGHTGPALFQYDHALLLARKEGREARVPRLLRKKAFLERCRARYPKALGYLVEARARLLQANDPREMAEVLRESALVEQALGEVSKAIGLLNEAIDLATERSDPEALARALLTLGNLEAQRGNQTQGLDDSLEALRIAERSGSLTEAARARIAVGSALAEMGRRSESLTYLEEGAELAARLGNLRLTAYATMDRAAVLLDLERYREAGGLLRVARGYLEILAEPDTLALLTINDGQWEMGMGRWSRAKRLWEQGIACLRDHGSPDDLARSLKTAGGFLVARGETAEGFAYLSEARDVASKLENRELLRELDRLLNHTAAASLHRNAV